MFDDIFRIKPALTRSISAENPTGEPGRGGACPLEEGSARNAARDLGTGWKVNPYYNVEPGATQTLADISGAGAVTHFWIVVPQPSRSWILRFYWDGAEAPSVEVPAGDFFCTGWQDAPRVASLPVCVNPKNAMNCYWRMPFRTGCRVTIENRSDKVGHVYYQLDYELCDVPQDAGYFHAFFNRVNPLPYKEPYVILDKLSGEGSYVGTYMAWGVNNNGWWGEGEIKFYLDGDKDLPTICGTGTEDYFCGSYDFCSSDGQNYETYTTPHAGLCQVILPDGHYRSQQRFGMYRWHLADPIRFQRDIRVTIQALGWRYGGRYLPLQDDIASTAFLYLSKPVATRPPLPGPDALEVI